VIKVQSEVPSPTSATSSTTSLFAIPVASETPTTSMPTSFITLTLFLFSPHHLTFPLGALRIKFFLAFLYTHFWLLEICGKPCMCAILAVLAFRTETTKVEWTKFFLLVVFECAMRTKGTEAAVVVGVI
jgi:hypothetical protein